jgi:hypothetical protein
VATPLTASFHLVNFRIRFDGGSRTAWMRLIKLGLVEEGLHEEPIF